ncbi:glycosyltransferase family 4 protein [Candidatus Microgenomates bacterium]|nr:glycosyltransferase family 4 protein [Candidatus Microgenomates bacterium]
MIKSVMVIVKHLIYGGAEKYTLNLVNALATKGVSVILVTGGGPLTKYISSKVRVFVMPISRKYRTKKVTEKKIQEIATEYKPQLIHTQCRTALMCVQLARNSLNIPVITSEHHMYEQQDYPFIVNELKDCADKIITAGPYTSKELVKYGLEKDKITTILNGIDVRQIVPVTDEERQSTRGFFNLSKADKVVVCLSRIEPGKGIDKLATGFIKVAKKVPRAKLIITGDDQWNLVKPIIKKIIDDNNLQDRCFVFPGEYDIRKYHAVADVFCYPAIAKGMAVMEAMAAGLPVVGNQTVRKPLVVEDNVSGLMIEPTALFKIDPDQIAKKLIYLLNRPELIKRMGKAARQRIEKRFNMDNVTKKTLKVYQQTIKPHKISGRETFLFLYDN